MNDQDEKDDLGFYLGQAKMLVKRLERISADSIWARRASGQRGALLKWLDLYRRGRNNDQQGEENIKEDLERIKSLIAASYALLEKAAQEYPENADEVRQK